MGFKYHKQINKTFNYQKGKNDEDIQINIMREGEKKINYSFNITIRQIKIKE
jgi:hypothetical protein